MSTNMVLLVCLFLVIDPELGKFVIIMSLPVTGAAHEPSLGIWRERERERESERKRVSRTYDYSKHLHIYTITLVYRFLL